MDSKQHALLVAQVHKEHQLDFNVHCQWALVYLSTPDLLSGLSISPRSACLEPMQGVKHRLVTSCHDTACAALIVMQSNHCSADGCMVVQAERGWYAFDAQLRTCKASRRLD